MTENPTDGQPEMTGRERQLAALAANREATQFKTGHAGNPDAGRTSSLRAQIRFLMTSGQLCKMPDGKWDMPLPVAAKPATIYAAQTLIDGLNAKTPSVRLKFMAWLTDQIDGKLVQPNLNADLADLQSKSDEEMDAYIEELQRIASQNGIRLGAAGEATTVVAGLENEQQHEPQQA